MEIKKEYNFNTLMQECWSGAIDTLEKVLKENKEDNLMELLSNMYVEEIPTITQINDFLWFEEDYILQELNIENEKEN